MIENYIKNGIILKTIQFDEETEKKRYEKVYTNGGNKTQEKEYFFDKEGRIRYEGKFKNCSKNGIGIHYSKGGQVLYKGEFKDGKYDGIGKLMDPELVFNDDTTQNYTQIVYEGQFIIGKRHGEGKSYSNGSLYYYGQFKNDMFNGFGITFFANGKKSYEGFFKNNRREGEGKEYDEDSGDIIYDGNFKNMRYEGIGIQYKKS